MIKAWAYAGEDFDDGPPDDLPVLVWAEEPPTEDYFHAEYADAYAERGDVPSSVLIEHGWYMPTPCCGDITHYTLEDNDRPVEEVVGTLFTETFCSEACRDRVRLYRIRCASIEDAAVQREKMALYRLLNRTVEITGTHAYACGEPIKIQDVRIYFKFPGQELGYCEFRDGQILVPQGEIENYMEWAKWK